MVLGILLLLSVSFSSIHPMHGKIQSLLDEKIDVNSNNSSEKMVVTAPSKNIDMKPILYSAILPGSGEYLMGYTNKAYIFFSIEALAVGIWYTFNQKGLDTQAEYRAFADEHWNLLTWFADYYKWEDSGNPYNYNFINEETGYYPHIYDDSHHLNFTYKNIYYSTSSIQFKELYSEEFFRNIYEPYSTNSGTVDLHSLEYYGIIVEKDHNYYENIGKYDHFYAGWEDNGFIEIGTQADGRGNIARSPYKIEYRNVWEESRLFHNIASYALSSIVANHFASMVDVLILSRLSNNKITNLSARTYFSPLNPYGIGGINFLFNWN